MQPDRKAHAARYWVFRGETRGGHSVAWGTTAEGCLPVMADPPQALSMGPSLTIGEPPPAVSTSITLADPDGEIAAMVLPDRRGRQGLSGKLYVGELEGGVASESEATPTLYAVGNAQHQDGLTTIQLQSDDSHILGRSVAMWTVVELLSGELDPERSPVYVGMNALSAMDAYLQTPAEIWQKIPGWVTDNLGSVVPWVYGPAPMEATPLGSSYPRVWVEGIRTADDRPPDGFDTFNTILRERDGFLEPIPDSLPPSEAVQAPVGFDFPLLIKDRDGLVRDVWARFIVQLEPPPEDDESGRVAVMQTTPRLRNESTQEIAYRSPPAVIAQVVRDHAPGGLDGVHWPSFEQAILEADAVYGDSCAGAFGSEGASVSELIQHLAPICGLRVWLGNDDKLHAGLAGYTFEDQEAAKGDLLELEEGDVFPRDTSGSPSLSSEIIGDPDDDSAGVARVTVEWSELQREIYPLETAATIGSVGEGSDDTERERRLSGAWLYPPRGSDVALAVMSGMTGDAARARLATHVSVRDVSVHGMMRVTHPAGLSLPGRGWDRRLTRVDGLEVMPSEDAVRLLLTDLGLSERMRLGLLDTVQQWILYLAEPGEDIEIDDLGDGHHLISMVGGYYPDAPWDDTSVTIWTPGAEEPGYRRSWRVMWAEGDDLVVESGDAPVGIHSLVAPAFADPVLGAGWAVMRTDLLDPAYRIDFIRACDLATGEMESGSRGFQWSSF